MSTDHPETIQHTETVMSEDSKEIETDQSMGSDTAMNTDHSEPSVSSDTIDPATSQSMLDPDGSETSKDEQAADVPANTDFETINTAALETEPDALTRLATEVESLNLQVEERTNQCIRIAADFDNFRKRTDREKGEIELRVKRDAISELLPVIDSFERARTHIKPQTEEEVNIHKSYQGVYKQLVDCLKRIGVSPMRVEGQLFDPNFHDAIMREPTHEHSEGTVIEELRRGYLLGELVLRHALVKVASLPEEAEAEPEKDLSDAATDES
jgi:molecular chaperone GrpE